MSGSRQLTLRSITIACLAFAAAICIMLSANVFTSRAETGVVNGWVAYNGNGETDRFPFTENYSSFISATDLGNGYTELWMNDGNQDFVNESPLDVSEPIVIEYNYSTASAWVFFSLIDNEHDVADDARSLSGDEPHQATAADHPEVGLVFGLGGPDSAVFGGNDQLMRYTPTGKTIVNKCGAARVDGEYTKLEIYFGKDSAAEGYIAADGVVIAQLNVTQDFFDSGNAIFKTTFWSGTTTLAIKTYNIDLADSCRNANGWKGIGGGNVMDMPNDDLSQFLSTENLGNGFTRLANPDPASGFYNTAALDITKPIMIEYNTRGDSNGWMFFSLIDNVADAIDAMHGLSNGETYNEKAADNPNVGLVFGTNLAGAMHFGGNDELMRYELTGNKNVNKSGESWQEGVYSQMEIYFGKDNASEGYIKIDGVAVATLNVLQSQFTSAKALLKVSTGSESKVDIKVYNAKGVSYAVTTEVNTGMRVDVTNNAVAGESVEVTLDINEGYRVTSLGWETADGTVTPFAKEGEYYEEGKYTFTMPEEAVKIIGVAEAYTITYNISQNIGEGITLRVDERSTEGATVEVSLTIAEGYRVTAFGWQRGSETITAFEKEGDYYEAGNYTFTMPAESVCIVGESEALFKITSETDKAMSISVDKWAGNGDTVTVTLNVAKNFTVTAFGWKTADSEVTPFALLENETEYVAGDYTFVMPEGNAIIVGSAQGVETVPDEITKSKASYAGWDTEHMIYSGIQYGAYTDAMNGAWIFEKGGGMTTFMIDHGSAIGNVNALDVSKPIYIDLAITAVDISGGHTSDGWSFIYFVDDWDMLREKSVNLYTDTSSYKTTLGWQGRIDISTLANWGDGAYWSDFDAAPLSSMNNPWGITCNEDEPSAWMPTSFLNIEIYFGETASQGYLRMGIDGNEKVKIATPILTQSDFINGDTYISFGSFFKTQAAVKIYQDASWVVDDKNISEHATVTMITEDTSNLKTFDEVKFTISCDDGYGISKVTAGGVDLKPDENGIYTHTCLFGINSLVVETGAEVNVSVYVNGGSAVENFTSSVGAMIEAPVSIREGYTLEWYADESLTTLFDFTQPLTADVSLYAKWSAVSYKINYYDGANKIRDLSKNTYTVEDTFTLETPKKDGYKFEGWYTDSLFTVQVTEVTNSTGDLTLYAKWSQKKSSGCGSFMNVTVCGVSIALLGAVSIACKKRKDN